jgi:hypothetical protein
MEAIGGFTADRALGAGAGLFGSAQSAGPASIGATALHSVPTEVVPDADAVDQAMAWLESNPITAEDTALWGFGRAADFADRVERLSRRVEHFQVVAAGAVERSRTAALTAAAAPLVPNADTGQATSAEAPSGPDAGAGRCQIDCVEAFDRGLIGESL